MEELASVSVWAECCGVELHASLCFIVGWQVSFFVKFMVTVGEWAFVLEFAFPEELPVSAHFSLEFHLILPNEIASLFFWIEVFLWFFDGSFFEVFAGWANTRNWIALYLSLWWIVVIISNWGGSIWIVIERFLSGAFSVLIIRHLKEVTLGTVLQ